MTATPLEELPAMTSLDAMDLRGRPVAGAQCRFDPELHTGPDDFESPEERAARELVAAQVCESCPLRGQCLELAMQIRPEFGVWAGYTAAELATLAEASDSFVLDLSEAA